MRTSIIKGHHQVVNSESKFSMTGRQENIKVTVGGDSKSSRDVGHDTAKKWSEIT